MSFATYWCQAQVSTGSVLEATRACVVQRIILENALFRAYKDGLRASSQKAMMMSVSCKEVLLQRFI